MKRSTTLFLPVLLLVMASCGTPAQYSQQRFPDGIYAKVGEEPEVVRLYSEEDFENMAAANIARKKGRDTLVVIIDDPWDFAWYSRYNRYHYAPWVWGGLAFGSYYWNRYYGRWDDAGKWAMFLKPENEPSFAVYADKADVNRFFVTMKQGNEEASDHMRLEMASRYYAMAMEKPELKTDLFKSQATAEELARIERVNIFKTKATDNKPSVILCVPTIDGNRLQAREVNQQQWQRMWLADDKQDYKTHLAASLFADVLRKERTDAVAVGTDKTEQEAQSETKEQTKNVEAHEEEDKKEEQKEEQTQSDKKQEEEKRRNSPEQKEKERKEEKAKEEATKAETKAVAAVVLSPIMKQFLDLKSKHPDALLLFRTGDFYETYQQDAEKASKILGITLTKSTKQKGPDGNAVKMAGFPYHALDTYLPKLIRAGERVAICDQLEAPKQTAKRGISELVSPGVASEKEAKAEPEKHQAFHR